MSAAYVYIDAGYIVGGCDRHGLDYRRLNLAHLAGHVASLCGRSLERTFIYDGIGDGPQSAERLERRAWLERNDQEASCHFRRGRIASEKREQKRVDVQLTVDVLRDARSGWIQSVVLVTGDDDFTPLVEAVRELGPQVGLILFPKHGGSEGIKRAADMVHYLDFGAGGWQAAYRDQAFV